MLEVTGYFRGFWRNIPDYESILAECYRDGWDAAVSAAMIQHGL